MEHQPANPTMILSLEGCSCESCQERLKSKLLKKSGIDSVTTVAEGTKTIIATVTGTVDPSSLVEKIRKFKIPVELISYERPAMNNKDRAEVKQRSTHKKSHYKCPNREDDRDQAFDQMSGRCSCRGGCCNGVLKKEEEHKCEAYVPIKFDEMTCRNFACKTHLPLRKIIDKVPAESSTFFPGLMYGGGLCSGGGSCDYHRHFMDIPQSGYYPSRRTLLGPYGFQ